MKGVSAAIFVAALASWGSSSATSTLAIDPFFVPDTTLRVTDSIPPEAPVISQPRISRGRGPVYYSKGSYSTGPDDRTGKILLIVSNRDGTPVSIDDVGYRFYLVDGELPGERSSLLSRTWKAFKAKQGAALRVFEWDDGATWEQEPFSFRMFVTAVDRAGNESAPSDTVVVADDGKQDRLFSSNDAAKQAAVREDEALANAMADLQGRWAGASGSGATTEFHVSGHEFTLVEGSNTIKGVFRLSTHRAGAISIDLTVESGLTVPSPLLGIVDVNSHSLRLCVEKPGAGRPSSLADGPNHTVYQLTRAR